MQQAPFSFHCRICYERLNLTDRPPVVLPCGHTYICQQCSQRLTRCMECRTRLFPVAEPKPAHAPSTHYPQGHNVRTSYRQRQQQQRQNYYLQKEQQQRKHKQQQQQQQQQQQFPVPTTVNELHTVLKATADASAAAVQERPPLPKNVVLMSLMEAAEQRHVQSKKDKDENEGYESGDDDERVLEGLRALSSSYGTYVVKAKEGLWVYDIKPHPLNHGLPLSRSNSLSSNDPPGKSPTKENDEPNNTTLPTTSAPATSSIARKVTRRRSSKTRAKSPSTVADPAVASGAYSDNSCGSYSRYPKPLSTAAAPGVAPNAQPKAMEKIPYGKTVQIVSFKHPVAQLARAAGYIRVDNEGDLVKVGEPTDEACRIEGIIFSLAEEKKQFKKRIHDIGKLEKKLQANLRAFFVREAEELEKKREQALIGQQQQQQQQEQKRDSSFSSKNSNSNVNVSTSVVEELLEEVEDDLNEYRDVTPPSTPPPGLLEMSPSESQSSETDTPASPRPVRRRASRKGSRNTKTAASAPTTTRYIYEMQDTNHTRNSVVTPTTTPTKDCTDTQPKTWEEELFNQGCDLFFCATMPLCVGHNTASTAVMGSDFHLHPASSILTHGQGGVGPSSYESPYRNYHHDEEYGIDRNDSYDGNSVNSNGVDFATGLSGHTGISRGKRRGRMAPRKQVRMMSQHDGIAHIRRQKGNGGATSGASVVSMGGCSKASIVTL